MIADLSGKIFNRWKVISFAYKKYNHAYWLSKCECGVTKIILGENIKRGLSKSCGCWNRELLDKRKSEGFSHCRTYKIWSGLLTRCRNKKSKAYKYYGARGINIHPRWRNYKNFLFDMGYAPQGLQIDRINNNGNYEPGNCRWADKFVNANNMSTNRVVFYEGKRQTMAQWCRELGLPYRLTIQRLNRDHWTLTQAFTGNKKETKNVHARKTEARPKELRAG